MAMMAETNVSISYSTKTIFIINVILLSTIMNHFVTEIIVCKCFEIFMTIL